MEDHLATFEKKYTGTISPSIIRIFAVHLLGNSMLTGATFIGNTTLYWYLSKYSQPVFLQKNLKYLFPYAHSSSSSNSSTKPNSRPVSPSTTRRSFKVDGILPSVLAQNGFSDDQPMMIVNIKGIKRKKQSAAKLGNIDIPGVTTRTTHETYCICELTLYDTTAGVNTPLCRSRRSCKITTPPPTGSQPYADHCTVELRSPFMIESNYFLSARSRRAKVHTDIHANETFAAHIALQPIQGCDFPPPMFECDSYEFEAFDHLEQAVADWKTLFNPLEGNLTTAILDLPELRIEGFQTSSVPDIVMLSPNGDFGKWNFGFDVMVGWDKQFSLTAAGNANAFGGGASPAQRLPTPQSDHAEGSVIYHFTYEAGKYTCRAGWTCPWCESHPSSFGSVDELEMHLKLNHELFLFRFERGQNGVTHVFVEIGHEFVNKRSAEKTADEKVFTHYHPKGKKRTIREYLKSADSEDSYQSIPTTVEKPTSVEHVPVPEIVREQRRRFKAPAIGEFYRSRSKRKIRPNEELSETEDEVSEDWLIVKHEETLEDFTDCTPREIRFMKLWDRFVNQDKPQGHKHLPESLMRFAHSHKATILKEHLRPELWKFLLNLKQYNRINNMVVKSVIAVIPRDPNPIKPESPGLKSPTKSPPRTPSGGRRGAPVPSAVAKTDEGSYCLCRSVWSNGMVACAREDCEVEWYHLTCINLWQKPTGRWVCPKCNSM